MPTLYSARDGSEARPNVRVTLTFRELRWMFGAYEAAHLLDYRERYAPRLDGAEAWEIEQRPQPDGRTPP